MFMVIKNCILDLTKQTISNNINLFVQNTTNMF